MAIDISFDFRFDAIGFFDDPDARAALDAAATIWESLIGDEFADVPAGVAFSVIDPFSQAETQVVLDAPIDDLLIFVGARPLDGPLGFAGPTGFDAQGDILRARISPDFRGQGPVTDFEPFAGTLTFNSEADWSFSIDSAVTGLSDFVSVALHEIGHILGISTAPIFNAIGADGFDGPNALSANGGAPVPLTEDGHVEEGFAQDTVLMDPFLQQGERVLPSQIDLALLADIGFQIAGFETQGSTPPIVTEAGDNPVFGTIVADLIDGLGGDDQIGGNGGNDTLRGAAGNDTLFGHSDDDLLEGGDGADRLFGGAGDDTLIGGAGDDLLDTGSGSAVVRPGAGADRVQAADGDARIEGSADDLGEDTVSGFGIGDEVRILGGLPDGVALEQLDGGAVLSGNASESGFEMLLFRDIDDGEPIIASAQGDDILITVGPPAAPAPEPGPPPDPGPGPGPEPDPEPEPVDVLVVGTEANDTLTGSVGDDSIFGQQGDDRLEGGGGDDNMGGGPGNDNLDGGTGDDTIGGGPGADSMQGGAGADFMGGGQGNDLLDGGPGKDVVNGGPGDDTINGSTGDDTMGGSFGDDVLRGGDGNDSLGGGAGRDTLDAGNGDDEIGGGEGDDVITGGAGDDFLAGGGRNDAIDGGDGADTINGGDGDDTMEGGEGADIFVFNFFKEQDRDVITDYEDGVDSFLIRTVNPETGDENISNSGNGLQGFLDTLNITDTDAGAQFDVDGHLVLVEGVAAVDLGVEDFQFV